ncbi:MAG: hypothetical protein KDA92_16280, partial [Planctomycetales bacterium]|nr:hypothetical protein [Planctomycetales bacterium]
LAADSPARHISDSSEIPSITRPMRQFPLPSMASRSRGAIPGGGWRRESIEIEPPITVERVGAELIRNEYGLGEICVDSLRCDA